MTKSILFLLMISTTAGVCFDGSDAGSAKTEIFMLIMSLLEEGKLKQKTKALFMTLVKVGVLLIIEIPNLVKKECTGMGL